MKKMMTAMVLPECTLFEKTQSPLVVTELPVPEPQDHEILIRISACGVCHTELDEIEGRTAPTFFPIILGHQVIGIVEKQGKKAFRHPEGARVGVGWIYSSCGACEYCRAGRENLCQQFRATGRDANGGYAEYMVANEAFAYTVPKTFKDSDAAPLLCAGAVGYRALRRSGIKDGGVLGLSGFGASAHIVLQIVKHLYPRTAVFVFTRSEIQQRFSLTLGASWAGDLEKNPPRLLDAVIDTTPVWKPLTTLLPHVKPGGRFVINAIRKENTDKHLLASLSFEDHFWQEREITSVANVAPADISDFLALAAAIPIRPETALYGLLQANQALADIKKGDQKGAKVLII
jgi:propanol-preferring alcohol dehydrogenase